MGVYQIDTSVLLKYLVIRNRASQRDHVSIGLFVTQRSQSRREKLLGPALQALRAGFR